MRCVVLHHNSLCLFSETGKFNETRVFLTCRSAHSRNSIVGLVRTFNRINWNNTVKQRYVDSNPITRRAIMVSVGTAATIHQHYDDDPIDSVYHNNIEEKENKRRLNNSNNIVSSRHTSRRRIRHTNLMYNGSSSNRRRTANPMTGSHHHFHQYATSDISHSTQSRHPRDHSSQQHPRFQKNYPSNAVYNGMTPKTTSRFSRQAISRSQYAASDISHAAYSHHPSIRSFQQDPYFQNNHTGNEVYNDMIQRTPSQFSRQAILTRPYAASGVSYATNSDHPPNQPIEQDRHFQKNHTSDEVYNDLIRKSPFRFSRQATSRTHSVTRNPVDRTCLSNHYGKNDFQSSRRTTEGSVNNSVLSHENLNCRPPSVGNNSDGIKRFQRRKDHHPVLTLEEDGSKMGPSFQISNDYWGDLDNRRRERKCQHLDSSRTDFGQWQPPELQPQTENSENASIFNLLKKGERCISPPNVTEISRFKRQRRGNTYTKTGEPCETQHIESSETAFAHRKVSNGVGLYPPKRAYRNGPGDQLEPSTPSIKFFDNRNEVDRWGKQLNVSIAQSPYRAQYNDRFGTPNTDICDEKFVEGRQQIVSQSRRKRYDQNRFANNRNGKFGEGRLLFAGQCRRRSFDQTQYIESRYDRFGEGRLPFASQSQRRSFDQAGW